MLDERLRQLKRQWQDSQDPQDAARYLGELRRLGYSPADFLREKLEVGLIDAKKLELASYLGYVPATQATGRAFPSADLGFWAEGIASWGKLLSLRAALAAADSVLPLWEAAMPQERRPAQAAAAARAYLECPCEMHASAATTAAQEAWQVEEDYTRSREDELRQAWRAAWPEEEDEVRAVAIAGATGSTAYVCRVANKNDAGKWVRQAVEGAALAVGAVKGTPTEEAARRAGEGQIRTAIAHALVPWAVGEGNP